MFWKRRIVFKKEVECLDKDVERDGHVVQFLQLFSAAQSSRAYTQQPLLLVCATDLLYKAFFS